MASKLQTAASSFHGVTDNEDLEKGLLHRDTRPLRHRAADFFTIYSGHVFAFMGLVVIAAPHFGLVYVSDALLVIAPFLWLYSRNKRKEYGFSTPVDEKDGKGKQGNGMFFVGNNVIDGSGIYFSKDIITTHMLVFGSTGSGKTRFLLGLFYQALLVGSGCMYVDGKGDNTVLWLAATLARRVGREDDFLVINFLTGSDGDRRKHERISNTMALFSNGDAEQIRSLLVGLMRDSGGDGAMWKGRASIMLKGVLNALVYLRDKQGINLDINLLQDSMPLDEVVNLSFRRDIPAQARLSIERYLAQLPGYTQEDAIKNAIAPKAYEQHGFLTMQLTEVLGDLSDAYGHITNSPQGEVDFKDLVFNRRILFVMLPALQRDPDSLAGLGKMAVAGVRAALGPALGNKAEGSKAEVIDVKPSASTVPFMIILDEYGYYSVPGFAVVAAQARSLGVSVVFAGQDYPSFQKGGEQEAASTVANTNIKIGMKLEDPDATYEILRKRAGQANMASLSGYDRETGKYLEDSKAKVDRIDRVSVRDLAGQGPGQAHIIFGDKLARMQGFYADPEQIKENRINKFLMINKPNQEEIKALRDSIDRVRNVIIGEHSEEGRKLPFDEGLKSLFQDMTSGTDHSLKGDAAARYAIGMQRVREELKTADFATKLAPEPKEERSSEPAKRAHESASPSRPVGVGEHSESRPSTKPAGPGPAGTADASLPPLPTAAGGGDEDFERELAEAEIGGLKDPAPEPALDIPDLPASSGTNNPEPETVTKSGEVGGQMEVIDTTPQQPSVSSRAAQVEQAALSALKDTVASTIFGKISKPLSPEQKIKLSVEGQLSAEAERQGMKPEDIDGAVNASVRVISDRVSYTDEPYPEKRSPDELKGSVDGIQSLLKRLKEDSDKL